MSKDFIIRPVASDEDLAALASLMAAYAASLQVDLAYQDFAAELAGLPGKYAPPAGELLLGLNPAGEPLGCVALRPILPNGCCEMKRLFLQPAARGLGLGKAIAAAVVETARRKGYKELRLDTLPSMTAAIRLYEDAGFQRIAPYYEGAPAGTIFMSLAL